MAGESWSCPSSAATLQRSGPALHLVVKIEMVQLTGVSGLENVRDLVPPIIYHKVVWLRER